MDDAADKTSACACSKCELSLWPRRGQLQMGRGGKPEVRPSTTGIDDKGPQPARFLQLNGRSELGRSFRFWSSRFLLSLPSVSFQAKIGCMMRYSGFVDMFPCERIVSSCPIQSDERVFGPAFNDNSATFAVMDDGGTGDEDRPCLVIGKVAHVRFSFTAGRCMHPNADLLRSGKAARYAQFTRAC